MSMLWYNTLDGKDLFSQWLGIAIIEARGYSKIRMTLREMILALGWFMAALLLADSAAAFACNNATIYPWPLDTSITFTKPQNPRETFDC